MIVYRKIWYDIWLTNFICIYLIFCYRIIYRRTITLINFENLFKARELDDLCCMYQNEISLCEEVGLKNAADYMGASKDQYEFDLISELKTKLTEDVTNQ